jgi:5-methylcytosine-specific restriction endonuclease McrA
VRRQCLVCGAPDAHEHHALPKSVWPLHRDNPDVFVPLCFHCHNDWHDGRARVYLEDLPLRTRALVTANASGPWVARWYPSRPNAGTPF